MMKSAWKDRLKKWSAYLIHPMAIGFYITLITVSFTFNFYSSSRSGDDMSGVSGMLFTAHQKSVDYRLRVRGPRKVHPDLALLTIDERAVATIGRWPWPRATLAKAVDQALNHGAKVLAFDIVFSEPSFNPAIEVQKAAESSAKLTPDLQRALGDLSPQLDNDEALGKVFAKHADKIVAGAFSAEITPTAWPGEDDYCLDLIFKMTPEAKQWDKEAALVSPQDPFQPYVPGALTEVFKETLQAREQDVRKKFGDVKTKTDQVLVDTQVANDLREACSSILTDFRDAFNDQWKEVVLAKEDVNNFKFQSYDEWLEDFKERSAKSSFMNAFSWELNVPSIAQGTKHTGFFNTEQDPDGTIRGKLLLAKTGFSYYPSIALKAFLVATDSNVIPHLDFNPASGLKELVKLEVTSNETGDPLFTIPTDAKSILALNYAGPEKMYPYVSFADLVTDSPEMTIEQRIYDPSDKHWKVETRKVKKAEFLKNKIFVVGATATGIYDLRVTPFQENFPGAETHLNAIDNILSKNFFYTPANERVYMPIVLGTVGLILSITLSFLGALPGLLLTLAFIAGIGLYDQYYLFNKGMVVAIVWPYFLISFLYVSLTFYRYLTEERGKKELRQTFQKYVSPAIVEEILADPQNIELGGKKVHLTVFFSDVRGFTTISEKLDPRALSDLLNSYLTPMTELVFANQGTLDKYMGDAIMAFFGAPVPVKDHAKHACRCALQSIEKLFELQKDWAAKGLPNIDLGIGLNTGEVSAGNMGSETVRSYTVMGDAVNLASRLEGINKTYGTRIILSEMTYNEVKDSFICREVDWVRVKGKALPVKIYELLAENTAPEPSMAEMLKWFQQGYEYYHQKAWAKGLECFSKVLDKIPTDEVSKLYVQRCQDYIQEPPDADWDGVFVMKTK